MARRKNRTIDRLQHDSDQSQVIDLTSETAQDRALDPITHEPVYTDRPADQDWGNMGAAQTPADRTRRLTSGDALTNTGEPVAASPVPPADMPEYPPPETRVVTRTVPEPVITGARLAPMAIITGVLTAFGLMMIGSIIAGVVAAGANASPSDVNTAQEIRTLGWSAGAVFVLGQFIAYLWGGYTAGRMARTNGLLHGVLVPLLALGIGALVVWGVSAAGETANLALPFTQGRFAIDSSTLVDFGAALGIASLVAMLLGGMIGGTLGTRWHRKKERQAIGDRYYADEHRMAS